MFFSYIYTLISSFLTQTHPISYFSFTSLTKTHITIKQRVTLSFIPQINMSKGEGRSGKKCLAYVALFVVFQAAIILLFALTVMKVKSPKVRFNTMVVESFSSSNSTATSINMKLLAQLTIKNTNFGHFKYDNATLVVLYNGVPLGEAVISRGRTKARKTQRFNINVDVSTDRVVSDGNLGNEINSGILKLSSQAKLNGKVHLMKIIKKKKSGEMNCDWSVNLGNRQVENMRCN